MVPFKGKWECAIIKQVQKLRQMASKRTFPIWLSWCHPELPDSNKIQDILSALLVPMGSWYDIKRVCCAVFFNYEIRSKQKYPTNPEAMITANKCSMMGLQSSFQMQSQLLIDGKSNVVYVYRTCVGMSSIPGLLVSLSTQMKQLSDSHLKSWLGAAIWVNWNLPQVSNLVLPPQSQYCPWLFHK